MGYKVVDSDEVTHRLIDAISALLAAKEILYNLLKLVENAATSADRSGTFSRK